MQVEHQGFLDPNMQSLCLHWYYFINTLRLFRIQLSHRHRRAPPKLSADSVGGTELKFHLQDDKSKVEEERGDAQAR